MKHRRWRVLGCCLCLVSAALWVTFSQVFLLHRNQGLGMYPAVKDGDLVLAWRLSGDPEKEDVVLYRQDGTVRMGRVAAVEKDLVMMDDSGSLLVNGSIQLGQVLYPTYARENGEYPRRVPEGTVYLLGDHRTQCLDSRDYGSIPLENILGKVIAIGRGRGI